jgi:Zn-dependent protease
MAVGSVSYDVDAVKTTVNRYFTVTDVYLDAGVLTFVVAEREIKERFRRCLYELKELGLIATARREEGFVRLRVYPYVRPPRNNVKIPLLLGLVTVATVSVDGFLRSSHPCSMVLAGYGGAQVLLNGFIFAATLMAIIFVHEMGHKLSAHIDRVAASHPYFIPGFPGVIPTLGAVIFQKEPLANRDDMFDIGISGPIAGFAVALAVTFIAFETAVWVPVERYTELLRLPECRENAVVEVPAIFILIGQLYAREGMVPIFMPVGFAAWLGMVVTALNLMPIWQLDGGRIFRSFLTRRQHQIASYLALGVLVLSGYYFMALLLILMMGRSVDIVPLDDVSPLSRWRKVSLLGLAAILVLSFVPLTRLF